MTTKHDKNGCYDFAEAIWYNCYCNKHNAYYWAFLSKLKRKGITI